MSKTIPDIVEQLRASDKKVQLIYGFNGTGKTRLSRTFKDTDSPFSYHLFLMSELDKAVTSGQIHKYHFNFLRNIFEKTSTFLGHKKWADLLPQVEGGSANPYAARIINISSHSKHAGDEVRELTEPEKQMVKYLVDHLADTFGFWRQEAQLD